MKLFLSPIILLPFFVLSQATNKSKATVLQKPEILTNGFIDVVNNGQLNAAARFIRLYIGEPGKFAIPLAVYSGVSSNTFQNTNTTSVINKNNDQLYNNFINPLSGLANISVDGIAFFNKDETKITRTGILYHFGEKVLTGYKSGPITNPQTGKPVNFLNIFVSSGLYFQTGAWERTNAKNLGLLWLTFRYIACYTNPANLKEILPNIETNGLYIGYCLGLGVEINNLINLKILYYKYTKEPEIDYSLPIYQFSFNYSLKN
jgi:hypothetical protein